MFLFIIGAICSALYNSRGTLMSYNDRSGNFRQFRNPVPNMSPGSGTSGLLNIGSRYQVSSLGFRTLVCHPCSLIK